MSGGNPEFSRLVSLARLGSKPVRQNIEAAPDEREGLARRFDLVALDRLTAAVTLRRQNGGQILLDATFDAEFAQTCVISLEPVPGAVSHSFSLVYGPASEAQTEIELGVEESVFEPLTADGIDIGEAVAQELSLALPEFPHLPGATIDAPAPTEPVDAPFAALTRLRKAPRD